MRIKGKLWKKYRCCGARKVLKTVPLKRDGLPDETWVAFVCVRRGRGEILPKAVAQALAKEFAQRQPGAA